MNNSSRVYVIGGGMLTAKDLQRMNEEEVRNRKYTHCTIDSGEYGSFLAKVVYCEISKAWNPSEVKFKGEWISIDEFDNMEGYNCYGCENYRTEPL